MPENLNGTVMLIFQILCKFSQLVADPVPIQYNHTPNW